MLRRRLSAGALRAAAQAQQPTATQQTAALHSAASGALRSGSVTPASAAAKATISTPQQSKSLASAVLLGTQRTWKTETVATLKAELKRRGLSQSGNKSTLVARLDSAEQSRLAPPVPPVSQAARLAAKARAQRSRSFTATSSTAATSTDQVVAHSSDVSAPKTAAPEAKELTKAQKTTAPGLPVDGPGKLDSSEFEILFPEGKKTPEREQIIPTLPHKFDAPKASASATQSNEPKVVTVASASTHPSGGPVHGDQKVHDADELERKLDSEKAAAEIAEDEIYTLSGLPDVPFKLSDIPLPPASEASGEYKASSRPLNDEERTGAWVIAGIVGVVALLGFSTKGKAKAKIEERAEAVKDKVVDTVDEYKTKVEGEVKRVVGKAEGKSK